MNKLATLLVASAGLCTSALLVHSTYAGAPRQGATTASSTLAEMVRRGTRTELDLTLGGQESLIPEGPRRGSRTTFEVSAADSGMVSTLPRRGIRDDA
jgi:hypothetical protein